MLLLPLPVLVALLLALLLGACVFVANVHVDRTLLVDEAWASGIEGPLRKQLRIADTRLDMFGGRVRRGSRKGVRVVSVGASGDWSAGN